MQKKTNTGSGLTATIAEAENSDLPPPCGSGPDCALSGKIHARRKLNTEAIISHIRTQQHKMIFSFKFSLKCDHFFAVLLCLLRFRPTARQPGDTSAMSLLSQATSGSKRTGLVVACGVVACVLCSTLLHFTVYGQFMTSAVDLLETGENFELTAKVPFRLCNIKTRTGNAKIKQISNSLSEQ